MNSCRRNGYRSSITMIRHGRGLFRFSIWLSIWWLLRLPVAVPDFHVVAHHDEPDAECPYHEHLNRWHSADGPSERPVAQPDPSALLHWHWILPGTSVPESDGAVPDDPTGIFLTAPPNLDRSDSLSAVLATLGHHNLVIEQASLDPAQARFETPPESIALSSNFHPPDLSLLLISQAHPSLYDDTDARGSRRMSNPLRC